MTGTPSVDEAQQPYIFKIPAELTQRILACCHPWDVAAFSQTCQLAYALIYGFEDEYLWRQLWNAHPFDDPTLVSKQREQYNLSTNGTIHSVRWKLTSLLKAELAAVSKQPSQLGLYEKKEALETFISVMIESPPALCSDQDLSLSSEIHVSANLSWIENVVRDSQLIATNLPLSPELCLLQARLRSCMGDIEFVRSRQAVVERRNNSRSFVYDLRNYDAETGYGPFLRNGNVNWVHVEHLVNVIWANVRDLILQRRAVHKPPFVGLEATRPYTAPGLPFSPHDWAGVQGTWRRYVCFMDYRDLFAFNVLNREYSSEDGPLHTKFFEDPRFREAIRLIEIKLCVVSPEDLRFYKKTPPSASPKHPTLFFKGISNGVNGNEAVVEGHVRMADDGTVRWKFVSIFDRHPQWSSHGVQMGDVGSAKGIIGVWTTTVYEQGDPVGPFWFWKTEDDCPGELIDHT